MTLFLLKYNNVQRLIDGFKVDNYKIKFKKKTKIVKNNAVIFYKYNKLKYLKLF